MISIFSASSLLLNYLIRSNSENEPKLLISRETKEIFTERSKFYQLLNENLLYTDLTSKDCVVIFPTDKKHIFSTKGKCDIEKGKIISEKPSNSLWKENTLFCSNYIRGPGENFIRIDSISTIVSKEEKDVGYEILNSTRVESGHKILGSDLNYAECAGEIKFKVKEIKENETLIEIISTNLQTSVYDHPEKIALDGLERVKIAKSLYKTNSWEEKGRKNKIKK
jgi:hypothetical protein